MKREQYYIRSNIARLEERLKMLQKNPRVFPILIGRVTKELEREKKKREGENGD